MEFTVRMLDLRHFRALSAVSAMSKIVRLRLFDDLGRQPARKIAARNKLCRRLYCLAASKSSKNGSADNKNEEGRKKTCRTWKSKLSRAF